MDEKPSYEELERRIALLESDSRLKNQTTLQLLDSEVSYRLILESISDTVIITDDLGNMIYVCPNTTHIFGFSQEEIYALQTIQKLMNGPVCDTAEIKNKGDIENLERSIKNSSGEVRLLLINAKSVKINNGTILYVMRDITDRKQAEKSMRNSEKKYQTLFENMAQGVFYQQEDGVLTDYNNAALELFGLTPDQFMGKTSLDPQWKVISEDGTELPGDKHPSMLALQTGRPVQDAVVGVYNPCTKSLKWLVVNAIPQFNKAGEKPYQVFVTLQDITDRKQSEEALRQSENKLRSTLDATPFPVAVVDLKDDKIFYWSSSALKLFGHTAPTASEWYQIAYPDPDYRQEVIERWKPFLGKARESGQPVNTGEYRVTCKDGSERICELYATFIPDNLIVTFQDITENKKLEEALQESEEKYRTVADFTYNMETWRMPDGTFRYVSPSCESITGYTAAEFLAAPDLLIKITHPDDQSKVIEHYLLAYQGAGTENMGIDFRILTSGGDIRWIGHLCTAVYGRDGHSLGRRESYSDITKRKQVEAALKEAHDECEQRVKSRTLELQMSHEQLLHSEKLAAVGKLSASFSHEFNNPLQSVMTIIKGIGRYVPLEKKDAELVDLALQECHRMKNLIASLRDFFKPTSDNLSEVDLHAIVKGFLLICKKDFHIRNITIVEKYADNIPIVMGVTDQLKQVLLNLLNNAADACQGGGVITITTEKIGENIAIHIEDNGIGISSTNITHIFEPFFTTKPELKGTGLGLSVSYGIIKKHGGRIDVKSESGKGSIFSVFLPIESVNNEQ